MLRTMPDAKTLVNTVAQCRFPLHVVAFRRSRRRTLIESDMQRWIQIKRLSISPGERALLHLMQHYPAFRSQFYFRLGPIGSVLARIVPGMPTLFFGMSPDDVGPGLFVQHGFATIVSARRIGANCWINQQVTIGYIGDDNCPIIGDDVRVSAGAQVLGAVQVGDRVTVAANATVITDVPDDSVVAGVPAHIVRDATQDDV